MIGVLLLYEIYVIPSHTGLDFLSGMGTMDGCLI